MSNPSVISRLTPYMGDKKYLLSLYLYSANPNICKLNKNKLNKNAVDGLSFTIKTGETVALIGTSGSGKTTIASLLAGFCNFDAGDLLIDGS